MAKYKILNTKIEDGEVIILIDYNGQSKEFHFSQDEFTDNKLIDVLKEQKLSSPSLGVQQTVSSLVGKSYDTVSETIK